MSVAPRKISIFLPILFLILLSSFLLTSASNYNADQLLGVSSSPAILGVPKGSSFPVANAQQNSSKHTDPSTWSQYISANRLAGSGCYSAKNLSSSWEKVPCVTAKPRPLSPKIVGNGYEPVLNASSGKL